MFPGIMPWFPVAQERSEQVKPIVNAIETLEDVNEKLRRLVLAHTFNPGLDLSCLTMKLTGILDAAVMGGVANYESAFLTSAYLDREPGDLQFVTRLRSLICTQVSIVHECLLIHERKAADDLADLQRHLRVCFDNLVKHMEDTYGVSMRNVQDDELVRDVEAATRKWTMRSGCLRN